MLLRATISTCLLLALGSSALADIAPMTFPAGHSLIPYARDRWIKGDIEATAVDVALQREELTIEVLPTLMKVRAVFWLRGGSRGEKALTIGFPEQLNPVYFLGQRKRLRFGHLRLPPLEELKIRVDDKTVGTRPVETSHPGSGKHLGRWRVFSAEIAAGATVKVEVSYVQWLWVSDDSSAGGALASCRDSEAGCTALGAMYYLLTGRLWQGPIGEAKIVLRLRGVDQRDLRVVPKPHASAKKELRWSFARWVPERDLWLQLNLSNTWLAQHRTAEQAPYDLRGFSPRHVLLDRLLRFNSLKTDPGPEPWERLIESLRELRTGPDKQVARLASETLAALHRRVKRHHCMLRDHAEVKRLLDWLAEDRGGCGEQGQEGPARVASVSADDLDRLAAGHLFREDSCFHNAPEVLLKLTNRRHRWRVVRWGSAGALVVLALVLTFVMLRRRRSSAG